jgi:multiple sugar transport system permease protein
MKTSSYKLYFFLIPALVYQLIFGIYPLIYNLILSLKDFNTLVFTGLSLSFQFIIGFLLALLFNRSFPLKGLLQSLIMIPWVLPIIVSGSFFRWFFSDRGIVNGFLLSWGLIDKAIPWLTSQRLPIFSVTMANIWLGIPFSFVLLYTGLRAIPLELFESADIDGTNWWQKILFITVPLLKPVIITTLTLGCIFTVKVFDLVWIITQGGPGDVSHLFSTLSYSLAFNKFHFGKASSVLVIMLWLVIGLTILLNSIRAEEESSIG